MTFRREKVTKLNLGPYKDSCRGPRVWGGDVTVSRLRAWDDALAPAEVAAENGKDIAKSPIGIGDFGTKVLGYDGNALRLRLPHHRFALIRLDARHCRP